MAKFKRLSDLDVKGKRVLVRVDFNVPLDDQLNVTSDARIVASLPTIQAILEKGGMPILMSHLGRPKGKVVESMRLKPAADRLAKLLGSPVKVCRSCVGAEAEAAAAALKVGETLVLENLRFHPQEEDGDETFAKNLAKLGQVYVNDAFGTAHRPHASTYGVAKLLPAAAGMLMEKEIDAFDKVLHEPKRPFLAILGGAKVSDKLPVILNLLDKVDGLIIGGAMAYTFLKHSGTGIGKSLCEQELLDQVRKIKNMAADKHVRLLLPVDHVCAPEFKADAPASTHGPAIPDGLMGLDIGPKSIAKFVEAIKQAKTIVWNGPMGVFEMDKFRKGTEAIAHAVADADAWTVVGGGDSVAAVELLKVDDKIDHVSTGGGASLELLEGKELPGVAALRV